jgi:isoleucyl-tRNA synthetase
VVIETNLQQRFTIQRLHHSAVFAKSGTGLSSHEVNQPGTYRDVTDTTIVAQFKTKSETLPSFLQGFGDIHILAWTTTPWTLPSQYTL